MSIYAFGIAPSNDLLMYRTYNHLLTSAQCDDLLSTTAEYESISGGIVQTADDEVTSEVKTEIRRVSVKHIPINPDTDWLYTTLDGVISEANTYYNFKLTGFMEQMQLLKYETITGGGHYNWHYDIGPANLSTRKLSIIMQLTDPSEYEGCDTELFGSGIIPKEKGTVVVFPSFIPHQVTPLISGTRDALVVWVNGHPFQ